MIEGRDLVTSLSMGAKWMVSHFVIWILSHINDLVSCQECTSGGKTRDYGMRRLRRSQSLERISSNTEDFHYKEQQPGGAGQL